MIESFYPLKARSINGTSVTFSLRDCPKYYNEEVLYLANKRGTELLYLNTITRGSDIFDIDGNRVYEGDIIQDLSSRIVYVVSFSAGFRFASLKGEEIELPNLHTFEIVGTVFEYFGVAQVKSFLKQDIHAHIRYKTRDGRSTFKLCNIVLAKPTGVVFKTSRSADFVKFEDLLQDANVKGLYGESLFYSERKYDKYQVAMKRGLVYYADGEILTPVLGAKKSIVL